jgi:diaminopimelate decarboxylase
MRSRRLPGPVDRAARAVAKRSIERVARRLLPHRRDLPMSLWGLARDPTDALTLRGLVLGDLLRRWGSPLHVVDATRLAENATRFQAVPQGAKRGCEVHCSYKTNPVPGVLRMLHALGLGAEVVSPYELWLALRIGVHPTAIIYNGPAKSADATTLALQREVGLINVNSRTEIAPLAALARRLGKRPTIGIRVVPPGAVAGQFGERIDNGAALAAFREALQYPELRVVAMHSHYNREIVSEGQLDAFLTTLLEFSDELRARLGLGLEVLDIGGSLACPTVSRLSWQTRRLATTLGCEPAPRPPQSVLSIDSYVERIVSRVERHFATTTQPPPRIVVEPGRALMSNAQMLLCRVAAIRDVDESGMTWAVLDAGLHAAEPMGSEFHQLYPLAPRRGSSPRLYRLSGPSCMLSDQVCAAWKLPELAVGDGIAIMDTGAYFVPYASCFSFPRPGIVAVGHGTERILRRRETFADLVALDVDDTRDIDETATFENQHATCPEGECEVAQAS